ncbi:peptide chain release factor-like protein [Pedobacter sp. JCM 36344]|uniref:peptide chain release factor-like protein n=1 Tax=Pedobacter sp. JCM 36344 TaxID=3374280 RepID=UPI00397C0B37
MLPDREDIIKSVIFKTSRSGGKGGQNVNKVSSKVELVLHIPSAPFFNDQEKSLLLEKLSTRLDTENNLHVVSQEDRSQLLNKERCIVKMIFLLKSALKLKKKRMVTKTPKSVIRKRLENKSIVSDKKGLRKKPQIDS